MKVLILALIILIVSCKNQEDKERRIVLPYYNEATFTPHWMNKDDAKLDTFHRISPFVLINQLGDTITEQNFEDKIYIVDFFFTVCPGICPKLTENMMLLQDEFLHDSNVLLLSHSVTPKKDTPDVLKKYADLRGIKSEKWSLVTGDQLEIYRLGRQEYFIEEDLGLEKEIDEFLHTENFVLIDKDRHIRGIYNGLNKTSIKHLIDDIKLLRVQ